MNISSNGNCNGRQWQQGPEHRTFATHLRRLGYKTFYAGKYLNQYGKPKVEQVFYFLFLGLRSAN